MVFAQQTNEQAHNKPTRNDAALQNDGPHHKFNCCARRRSAREPYLAGVHFARCNHTQFRARRPQRVREIAKVLVPDLRLSDTCD